MTIQQTHTDVVAGRQNRIAKMLTAAGVVIVLLLSGVAAGADAPPATTQPTLITSGLASDGSVKLITGRSVVLTSRAALKRVSLGQPDIAEITVMSPNSVLITAKKSGSTQLIVWDDQDQSQLIDLDVDLDLASVGRAIKAAYPNVNITTTPLNDAISLRGNVPSAEVAEQIAEIASAFGKVHNFMEISGGQQVMLQVKFAEVAKTTERDLGVNFAGTDGISIFGNNAGVLNPFALTGNPSILQSAVTSGAGTLFGQGRYGTTTFQYFIQALRQNGLVRVLAEPNVIAISGQTATFLAGGEVPIPVPQGGASGGTTTVDYHEFGVRLNFAPVVLGDGRIRLKVAPEVSDLDFADGSTINGGRVPAFTKQNVSTTVELADGQSFALAGLLKNNVNATINSIPGLGDLPVLGLLFRSTQYQRQETELVIMVTPRLVEPMNPDQVPALPGEHWKYPTGPQLYIASYLGGPTAPPGMTPAQQKSSAPAGPAAPYQGSWGFSPAGNGQPTPPPAP
jgi:pilus assembly protein CpaC